MIREKSKSFLENREHRFWYLLHHLQDKCGSWKSPPEKQKLAQSLVVRDRVVGWNIRKATRSDSPSSKNREEARDRKSDTKKN